MLTIKSKLTSIIQVCLWSQNETRVNCARIHYTECLIQHRFRNDHFRVSLLNKRVLWSCEVALYDSRKDLLTLISADIDCLWCRDDIIVRSLKRNICICIDKRSGQWDHPCWIILITISLFKFSGKRGGNLTQLEFCQRFLCVGLSLKLLFDIMNFSADNIQV